MASLLAYAGASLSSARIPAARRALIDVSAPADLLVATVGGREVGRAGGLGQPVSTVTCDLRGLLGRTGIRVSRIGRFTENIDKSFIAVPDPTPGPDNTGVRPGITLTPSARLTFRTPGETVEGLRLTGATRVMADDVTFRNCLFEHDSIVISGSGQRATLEDCEVDGLSGASMGVMLSGVTLRRVNIHHTCDGVRLNGTDPLVVDSWIHHLVRQGDWHPDCIQTSGSTRAVVRHCVLDAYNPDNGDLNNAAIQIGGEQAPLTDFLVEDCYVNGGSYSINVGWALAGYMVGPITLRGVEFGPNSRYGPLVHAKAAPVVTDALVRSDGTSAVARFHD